jgi:AcrR family transcriptional regulator
MMEPVKSPRTYVSTLRAEQAVSTRRSILEAARRLFERDGYAGTSIPAIAAEAHVAVKTLYLGFSSKPELLRAVWGQRLAGDEAATPVLERAWYREVEEDESAHAKLRLLAHQSGRVKSRTGRLLIVIRDAADSHPEVGALWNEIEAKLHEVATAIVEQLVASASLRPGLDASEAADVLWAVNHPSMWHLLVARRGWSDDTYETWLARTFEEQLLEEPVC